MYRNQAGSSWVSKALTFSLSAALAGVMAGVLLGAVGSQLLLEIRLAGISLLAVLAIAVGGLELGSQRFRPFQRSCETPQGWIHTGALRWALRNGWTLGLGATTRIGFWLWYLVPIAALLSGKPELGALIYGTYSFTRGAAVWVIILGPGRWVGADAVAMWLLGQAEVARTLTAGQLVLVGIAVALAIGV